MLSSRSKNILMTAGFGSAVAIATMLLPPSASHAVETSKPHPFKSASIAWNPGDDGRGSPHPIYVEHDGERYTGLHGNVITGFKIKASVRSGHRIYGYVVTTGDPAVADLLAGEFIGASEALEWPERTLEKDVTFRMNTSTAVGTGTLGIEPTRKQDIIDSCNNAFDELPPVTQELNQAIDIHVHLGVASGEKKGVGLGKEFNAGGWWTDSAEGRPAIAHASFPATILCMGRPAAQEVTPKVLDTSWHVALAAQNSCPKEAKVTAAIATEGPRSLDLRINRDGQVSKWFTVQAKKATIAGGEGYLALFEHTLGRQLGPGEKRLRLEIKGEDPTPWKTVKVTCPPFKVFSTWLKYEVAKTPYCSKQVVETVTFKATRPGFIPYRIKIQGGAVAHEGVTFAKFKDDEYVAKVTRTLTMNEFDKDMIAEVKNDPAANSGWTRLKVDCLDVAGATLTLRDENGPSCTRGETAAIAIRTDLEGPVPYRLDCTGGRSFTGTAVAHKTGSGTFIGVDTRKLAISKTEQINCALKTTINGKTKIVALRGHSYQCVKRNVGSASDDVVNVPDPTHDRPKPTVVVDPVPDFTCVNGRKVGGKCKCRRGHRLVRIGSRHYRCDTEKPDVVITPPTRIPDPAVVSCNNGRKILEALKKAQEAKKRAAAERRRKAAKTAAEARRKRKAAKKAAEARRKRKAAKKAAEARRKREAAKKAAAAKRKAAAKRRSAISSAQKKTKRLR